jgi:hypothetical protein
MENNGMYGTMRIVSYVVLLAMVGAFVYVAYITLSHWTGIGV